MALRSFLSLQPNLDVRLELRSLLNFISLWDYYPIYMRNR